MRKFILKGWFSAFIAIFQLFKIEAIYTPPPLNMSTFHVAIRKAFDASNNIVKPLNEHISVKTDNTECYIPIKGIMFSLANSHMIDLIELQHNAMDVWNMRECLESRFITLCLDTNCFKQCTKKRIKNCVDLSFENSFEISLSDFALGVSVVLLSLCCYAWL